ncbi:hypothetical protein KR222_008046, partial [Zaprionus bogoriensis]
QLLHCITKLFNLPITFEHLQETGIGKTVNALRKINGEVGVAAKTLVTKWKAMVAAEEEPSTGGGHSAQPNHSTEEDSQRSNGRRSSDEDPDQENKGSNSSGGDGEDTRRKHKSKHHDEEQHERHGKSSKSTSTSTSSSSSKSSKSHHSKSRSESDSKRHKSSSSDDKDKEKAKSRSSNRGEHKSSSERSKPKESATKQQSSSSQAGSNHKSSSSSGSSGDKQRHQSSSHRSEHSSSKSKHDKKEEQLEKSDKHKSSSASSKSSKRSRSPQRTDGDQPQSKKSKSKSKPDAAEPKGAESAAAADGFDSSMGANFDDVLGMLNMPMSGKKVSSKPKTPSKSTSAAAAAATTTAGTAAKRTITTTTTAAPANSRNLSSSRQASTKPELLASSAKLEPLDPSIALELPTISNNYKPMPLNQTVMDVVFNQGLGSSGSSSSAHRPTRSINESEALAAGISSKTMRTKIYSGVRTGQILQVPSLFDLCTRVLQKNIDALEYTGGVPFEVLRPVLERATPHQLLNFEEYNPYLMDDSDVLWKQHVQRHCRSQRREEMETWREMFLFNILYIYLYRPQRCEEEKERKLSTIAESIKASQKISEAPVRKTQLAFVDSMVKPPRSVQRKQEQYGTKGKLIATPAARVAALSSVTPNAAKVGDARLRVLSAARDTAQVAAAPMRNKKAPLMAKALQLIRGRQRR